MKALRLPLLPAAMLGLSLLCIAVLAAGAAKAAKPKAEPRSVTGLIPRAEIPANPTNPHAPLVVLDPGHGTRDSSGRITGQGASGRYKGREIPEHELTLDYAMWLMAELRRRNIRCESTRTYSHPWFNVSYRGHDQEANNKLRAEFAAREGAALFVRIHFDGSTNKADSGYSVYYDDQSKYDSPPGGKGKLATQSLRAAKLIDAALRGASKLDDLGVKRFERPIYGFVYAKQPAVLLELGYLSNPHDCAYLLEPETVKGIAAAVAQGIADYLGR